MLIFPGGLAVISFVIAMYFHNYEINRLIEVIFFGLTAASAMIFQYNLHIFTIDKIRKS